MSKTIWDELSGASREQLPKPKGIINDRQASLIIDEKRSVLYPISTLLLMIGFFTQMWLNGITNLSIGFIVLSMMILVYQVWYYFKPSSFLELSLKGVSYNKVGFDFEEIDDIYINRQDTGDEVIIELVAKKATGEIVSISLDDFEMYPNQVIKEIGKFYWSWSEIKESINKGK